MARNNNYPSLQVIDFKPITFTPTQYKQKTLDWTPIKTSIKEFYDKTIEAKKERNAISSTMQKLSANLRPEEQSYITEMSNKINDNINVGLHSSDPFLAHNIAIDEADKLANNKDLLGRIEASDYYNKYETAVMNMTGVSDRDKKFILKENKYNYTPEFDEFGNIRTDTKGTYNKYNLPQKSIDYQSYTKTAASLINPDTKSYNNENGSGSTTKITIDEIKNNFNEIFNNQTSYEELNQDYRFSLLELDDLKTEIEKTEDENQKQILKDRESQLKSFLYDESGNVITDLKEYAARHIYATMNNLAYINTHTGTKNIDISPNANISLPTWDINIGIDEDNNTKGPFVIQKEENDTPSNAHNMLNNAKLASSSKDDNYGFDSNDIIKNSPYAYKKPKR